MSLLLAVAVASVGVPAIASTESAAESLRRCGFAEVRVEFDEDLQEEVLSVSDVGSATDDQISCAAHVTLQTYYYVNFSAETHLRYWNALALLQKARGREIARSELTDEGSLDKIPTYDPSRMSDADFANQLELFCGPEASGSLKSKYGPHAIGPDWVTNQSNFEAMGKTLVCLLQTSAAAGFEMGIIGNEAMASGVE